MSSVKQNKGLVLFCVCYKFRSRKPKTFRDESLLLLMFSVFQIKNELQASVFKVEESMLALAGMLLLKEEDFILVLALAGILLFKEEDFILVLALAGGGAGVKSTGGEEGQEG